MKKEGISTIIILVSMFLLMVSYVYATATNPTGPQSLNQTASSRFNTSNWPALSVNAEAGNVTELTIYSLTQTQSWQGYYGNITGTITLDDANNWTMYDWYMAEPQGEIYASNTSSVTWSNIMCLNYTANSSQSNINLTKVETMFGMAPDDYDGVNETFSITGQLSDNADPTVRSVNHPLFYVGTHTIAAGSCPATDTYQADSSLQTDFVEVLLTDNNSIIFTTIIENNIVGNDTDLLGYDNRSHDFQMLVGENGHDGDDETTPYYFFVELE